MPKIKQRRTNGLIDILLRRYFPNAKLDDTFITIGRRIYAPHGASIPIEILQHELIHVAQQKNLWGAIKWWYQYVRSAEFRFSQELPAFLEQYRSQAAGALDRNARARIRWRIAIGMSGAHYNRMCSQKEALGALNEYETRIYRELASRRRV